MTGPSLSSCMHTLWVYYNSSTACDGRTTWHNTPYRQVTEEHSPQVDLPLQHSGMGHPAGVPLQQPIGRACPAATRAWSSHTLNQYRPRRPPADGPIGLAAKEGRAPGSYRQGSHACSHASNNCFTLTDELSRTLYVSHCIPSNAKLKYLADTGGFARPDLLPPRPPNDAVGVGRPLSWCEEPVPLRSGTSCH